MESFLLFLKLTRSNWCHHFLSRMKPPNPKDSTTIQHRKENLSEILKLCQVRKMRITQSPDADTEMCLPHSTAAKCWRFSCKGSVSSCWLTSSLGSPAQSNSGQFLCYTQTLALSIPLDQAAGRETHQLLTRQSSCRTNIDQFTSSEIFKFCWLSYLGRQTHTQTDR